MSHEDIARQLTDLQRRIENLERIEPSIVAASYSTDAGQSIANNSSTIVDFEDQTFDTHSAVTTGASWKFTVPIAGYYVVVAKVLFAQTTNWAETEQIDLRLFISGSGNIRLTRPIGADTSGSAQFFGAEGVGMVNLSTSAYIDLRVTQLSGSSLALHTDGNHNHITIWKL